MKACKYAKKYKGVRPPRCNHDNPCEKCKAIRLAALKRRY